MRIGIDITALQTGHQYRGVGTYVRNLVVQFMLLNKEDDFFLFCYKGIEFDLPKPFPETFKIIEINHPNFLRFNAIISHQIILPFLVKKYALNLFHFPFLGESPWVAGIPFCFPIPFVITVCDLIPLHYSDKRFRHIHWRIFYYLQRKRSKSACHIITLSEASRKDIITFLKINHKNVTPIYLASDNTVKSDSREVSSTVSALLGKEYILYVGGDFPHKNLNALLGAYSHIRGAAEDYPLLVLVGAFNRDIKSLIRTYPNAYSYMVNVRDVTPTELELLYQNAILFVFPSVYEGFGLPPLEAMSHRIPTIASSESCMPEILGNGAYLVIKPDEEHFAEAIQNVLTNPELSTKLSKLGKLRSQKFSWEETANKTMDVYRSILF